MYDAGPMTQYVMPGKERSPAAVIVLSLVTFGLYMFYWQWVTLDDLKMWRGGRGWSGTMLLLVLLPPVSIVLIAVPFLIPSYLADLYRRHGMHANLSGAMGLLLFIPLVGFIIYVILVQNALNEFWEHQERKATTAATRRSLPATAPAGALAPTSQSAGHGGAQTSSASQHQGVCSLCGQMFVEATRRRPKAGETWSGVLAEASEEGVCPRCFLERREKSELHSWTEADWRTYCDERAAGVRTSMEARALLEEVEGCPSEEAKQQARELVRTMTRQETGTGVGSAGEASGTARPTTEGQGRYVGQVEAIESGDLFGMRIVAGEILFEVSTSGEARGPAGTWGFVTKDGRLMARKVMDKGQEVGRFDDTTFLVSGKPVGRLASRHPH